MPHKFSNVTSKTTPKSVTNRHSGNDVLIAKAFVAKASSSADRGIEFTLSFTSFKNMCKAKKCYFTGLTLTPETFTIDRIDNSKGYVRGNVAACHKDFNSLKSLIENPTTQLDMNLCLKGLTKTVKRMKYIVTTRESGIEEMFVFPETINHDCMSEMISRIKNHGAGNA